MTRFASMLLALALPLAACDAGAPAAEEPAVAPSTATAPASAPPATMPDASAAAATPRPEPTIEQLAAVEEPTGDAAVADTSPTVTAQATPAATEPFQEGKNYVRLPVAQPTSSPPEQVEVAEAFMYSCPHCAAFEPELARWVSHKPANVSFVRLPVNFNPVAALHMRAYYTAETLGVLESIHQPFFDEVHVKKNPLADVDSLAKFFAAHGVDEKTFKDTMASFAIDTKMRKAETLLRRYQVASVPTLIINGKYRTDVGMAGGPVKLFEILEFLIHKEQTEGAGEAPATSSTG